MKAVLKLRAAKAAIVEPHSDTLRRCDHALELLLRIAGIPLSRLSGCSLKTLTACSAIACAPRSSCVPMPALRNPSLPRAWPPSRHYAQTSTTLRVVTRPRRVLGLRGIRLLQSNVTAGASLIGRATFSRSWSHMHWTSAWDGDA